MLYVFIIIGLWLMSYIYESISTYHKITFLNNIIDTMADLMNSNKISKSKHFLIDNQEEIYDSTKDIYLNFPQALSSESDVIESSRSIYNELSDAVPRLKYKLKKSFFPRSILSSLLIFPSKILSAFGINFKHITTNNLISLAIWLLAYLGNNWSKIIGVIKIISN